MALEKDERYLLIAMQQDIRWLKEIMGNHLAHHWIITISVALSMLGAIGTLVLYLTTKVLIWKS